MGENQDDLCTTAREWSGSGSIFGDPSQSLAQFDTWTLDKPGRDALKTWIAMLRNHGVYFCHPLDLDYSMLHACSVAYRVLEYGRTGPSDKGDAKSIVLGDDGDPTVYPKSSDENFRWYLCLAKMSSARNRAQSLTVKTALGSCDLPKFDVPSSD